MIPPTPNELKQHSINLSDFGKKLHKFDGSGSAMVNVAVIAITLVSVLSFISPMFAGVA